MFVRSRKARPVDALEGWLAEPFASVVKVMFAVFVVLAIMSQVSGW